MKIINCEIKSFIEFLMSFELVGKTSRLRTRFCKLLSERLKLVEDERSELIFQYGEKGDDGNVKISSNNGRDEFVLADREGFINEYELLMSEHYFIDQTLDRKEMLLTIQDIVLNCERVFSGEDAMIYDYWCEIVEEIDYK